MTVSYDYDMIAANDMPGEYMVREFRFHLKLLIAHYEERTGNRLTYRDLSEATGISTNTIYKIANNQQRMVHLSVLERLLDFFHCDLEDLLSLEPEYEVKQSDE